MQPLTFKGTPFCPPHVPFLSRSFLKTWRPHFVLILPRIESLNLQHATLNIQGNLILSSPCSFPPKIVSEKQGNLILSSSSPGFVTNRWNTKPTKPQNLNRLAIFVPTPPNPTGKGKERERGKGKGKGNHQTLTSEEKMKHVVFNV